MDDQSPGGFSFPAWSAPLVGAIAGGLIALTIDNDIPGSRVIKYSTAIGIGVIGGGVIWVKSLFFKDH